VHFDGLTFDNGDAGNSHFMECAFTNIEISGGIYRRARLNDVWIKNTRIVGADMAEGEWTDLTMIASSLAALAIYGAKFMHVTFKQCKLDSVNFREAVLNDVTFADCTLRDVDLSSAKLTNVRFAGSLLQGAHFSKATLAKVDFRGAREIELAAGYESLRGGIIDSRQLIELAPALAATLGIKVDDR
jgi:uncharacterized protein YjbI with pentapeptide repeats